MKRFLLIILLFLSVSFGTAQASEYKIKATWDQNPEADLAGYNLYKDGVKIATIMAPATSWEGTVTNNGERVAFTLTAFDTAGQESLPCDPVYFDFPPSKPAGVKIILEFILQAGGAQ
jgi:hypothetical protein